MNPYYKDYSEYLSSFFEGKIQKLSVDAAFSCPNRDGTTGTGGCIYCSNVAFSPDWEKRHLGVAAQISRGKAFFARKYPSMRYLAYFQSYTSTWGDAARILPLYREALAQPDIVGIIIGTRPDCLPDELLGELADINRGDKRVFIEFGAESSHDSTLQRINRCHTWQTTVDAVWRVHKAGIQVGLHFIMGLPGETRPMMLETVRQINNLPVDTVKFHHLQILRGTPLARAVAEGTIADFEQFTPESYAGLCLEIISLLRKDIAIERFLAQAPSELLISPRWGLKNYEFTNILNRKLALRYGSGGRGEESSSVAMS